MPPQLRSFAVRLTEPSEAVAASTNHDSVATKILGSIAASAVWKGLDRTTGNETYDAKIQHSPDPFDIDDDDASWFDLITFTQVTVPNAQLSTLTTPHFSRMRAVSTLGGTTPSGTLDVLVEGVPF